MAAQLYKTTTGHMFHAGNIALVSVGLPARGKTYFAHKLSRYFRWLGIPTKIFSVGDYRREMIGTRLEHDFFNSSSTAQQRLDVANLALQDLIDWFQKDGGQVAIYDASNVEQSRRQFIHDRLSAERIQVLFVEAICDRDDIIQANIRQVKLNSPDYLGMDPDKAVQDFLKRIEGYRPIYETINDPSFSYIKNINVGERIIVNKVNGYLPSRIVYYLMNLHIMPRRIYLCRNGATVNEAAFRTDAPLSPMGEQFATQLPRFLAGLRRKQNLTGQLQVWTSPRQRSIGTASHFKDLFDSSQCSIHRKSHLVEINLGEADGLSAEQVQKLYPEEWEMHQKDPYYHRYPRAESYHDLALRVEDILLELERERDDILIVAHQTVLRCIYAYLLDRSEDEIPTTVIPMNTVFELFPQAYGCIETRHVVQDLLHVHTFFLALLACIILIAIPSSAQEEESTKKNLTDLIANPNSDVGIPHIGIPMVDYCISNLSRVLLAQSFNDICPAGGAECLCGNLTVISTRFMEYGANRTAECSQMMFDTFQSAMSKQIVGSCAENGMTATLGSAASAIAYSLKYLAVSFIVAALMTFVAVF